MQILRRRAISSAPCASRIDDCCAAFIQAFVSIAVFALVLPHSLIVGLSCSQKTAVMFAAEAGRCNAVKVLVEAKADIRATARFVLWMCACGQLHDGHD